MNRQFKRIFSLLVVAFMVFTFFGCHKNQVDNEKILKDLINYHQENMSQLIEVESQPEEYLKVVEQVNSKMSEQFEEYFTADAFHILKTEVVGSIQNQLKDLSLPITITDTNTEGKDTQTITIQFEDSKKNKGEFQFKVQNTDRKISFIKIEE